LALGAVAVVPPGSGACSGEAGGPLAPSHFFPLAPGPSRYDSPTDSFSPCVNGFLPVPTEAGISADATGDRVPYGRTVEDASLGLVWAIMADPAQPPAAISPDGTAGYFGVG